LHVIDEHSNVITISGIEKKSEEINEGALPASLK